MLRIARTYGDSVNITVYANEDEILKRAHVKLASVAKRLFKRAQLVSVTSKDIAPSSDDKGGSGIQTGTLVVEAVFRQGARKKPFLFAFDIDGGDITEIADVFCGYNGEEYPLDPEGARYAMSIKEDSIVNTAGKKIKSLLWQKVGDKVRGKPVKSQGIMQDLKDKYADKALAEGVERPADPTVTPDAQRLKDVKKHVTQPATPEQEAATSESFAKLDKFQAEIEGLRTKQAELKAEMQSYVERIAATGKDISGKQENMQTIIKEVTANLNFIEAGIIEFPDRFLQRRSAAGDVKVKGPSAEAILDTLIGQIPEIKGRITRIYNKAAIAEGQPDELIMRKKPEVKSQADPEMSRLNEIRVELFELAKMVADWGKTMVSYETGNAGIAPNMPAPLPVSAKKREERFAAGNRQKQGVKETPKTARPAVPGPGSPKQVISQNEIMAKWNRNEISDAEASKLLSGLRDVKKSR